VHHHSNGPVLVCFLISDLPPTPHVDLDERFVLVAYSVVVPDGVLSPYVSGLSDLANLSFRFKRRFREKERLGWKKKEGRRKREIKSMAFIQYDVPSSFPDLLFVLFSSPGANPIMQLDRR
jgi:hypothetical protein